MRIPTAIPSSLFSGVTVSLAIYPQNMRYASLFVLGCVCLLACARILGIEDTYIGDAGDARESNTGDARASDAGDGSDPADAAPPRFMRVFHIARVGDRRVVYANDIREGEVGAPVAISEPTLNPMAFASSLNSDATGTVVTFISDGRQAYRNDLMAVRFGATGPGPAVRISSDQPGSSNYVMFSHIKPDGSAAIYAWGYRDSYGTQYVSRFYFVGLAEEQPGAPVELGPGSYFDGFLSANGEKYAFFTDYGAYVVDVQRAVPSVAAQVNGDLVSGGRIHTMQISPGGQRIAYLADAETPGVNELFVVDVSGATPGPARKVPVTLAAGLDVGYNFSFSADGTKLAFLAGGGPNSQWDLYVADISGPEPGTPKKVNGTLASGGSVGSGAYYGTSAFFQFSPDSRRIAYFADQRANELYELFLADIATDSASEPQRLSPTLVEGGDVSGFSFAPDSSGLVITADAQLDEVVELYYVDLRAATPSAPQRVNGELIMGGDVQRTVALSGDGRWVAYVADQAVDQQFEVWLADVSTGQVRAPRRLQEATNATSTVPSLEFSADSSALVWSSNSAAATKDLWMADVSADTAGQAVKLNVADEAVDVEEFRIAP